MEREEVEREEGWREEGWREREVEVEEKERWILIAPESSLLILVPNCNSFLMGYIWM